uniref:Uncharacterized protein n=1 Tax=Spongospora subterranea TaxID=70186 RepID=A0A0H5RR70_9EUKA|eukprot:CRZ11219.1 hypothetical protein [Spongospora subterranea]
MDDDEFSIAMQVFSQASTSDIQGWDGETVDDAIAWASYLETPNILRIDQSTRCFSQGINPQSAIRSLISFITRNSFCPTQVMAALLSRVDHQLFCDELSPLVHLEARAELELQQYNQKERSLAVMKATGQAILMNLEQSFSSKRMDLLSSLAADPDMIKHMFWALAQSDILLRKKNSLSIIRNIETVLLDANLTKEHVSTFFVQSCNASTQFCTKCIGLILSRIMAKLPSSAGRILHYDSTQIEMNLLKDAVFNADLSVRLILEQCLDDVGFSETVLKDLKAHLLIKPR